MEETLLSKISKDKFGEDLLTEVCELSRANPALISIKNIYRLLECELEESDLTVLVKSHDFYLPQIQIENIELLARWYDAKFMLGLENKISNIKDAFRLYNKLYIETGNLDYLVRAIQLVKKVQSAFNHEIPQLKSDVEEIIIKLESSHSQLQIIVNSAFLNLENSSDSLIKYFTTELESRLKVHRYTDAKNFIQILNILKNLNNTDCKIQMAMCLEKEADYLNSKKEVNTYYPNILHIYTDALNEIQGIVVSQEFRNRLEEKIKLEQKLLTEMLSHVSVPIKSDLNIPKLVETLNINSFNSGLKSLMALPIIDSEALTSSIQNNQKKYYFKDFLENALHITSKGTVSGTSNMEQYDLNFKRDHYRRSLVSVISEVKKIMDSHMTLSPRLLAEIISRCRSLFVPSERKAFFYEGLYSGFQNNFIVSSHILIPQIENSLKQIIELNGRNTVNLSAEIQNDNMLGSVLCTKGNGKMLDGICDRNLLLELNSFLIDGNSINFRNRLCHGLLSPDESYQWGIYLWWLTLKMVMKTSDYFKIP